MKIEIEVFDLMRNFSIIIFCFCYVRNILEMVAIQRRDNLMWAIPGGMVDPGEKATATLKREFTEEALNSNKGESI